ncbi:cell envelope integrity protein TolA [Nitrosovibrio sp. Nv17]|uniref:cell envelope integrity protein TolA n=1 Tax=Nitrosovibrio sp. Nv17 TaxID=1855339 RepID=UPI000909098A|nr:cell envelope integrity protein TolA [Nitrosovibrio sp. Nv17]SFW27856.1 Cell division and transport-associated protein TolA [Nitrosovibrio sp. Nv17]
MLETSRSGEPGRLPAGLLALGVHIAFLALLVFGLQWKTHEPEAVMVDLWSQLPPLERPAAPPQAQPPAPPPARVKPLPPQPQTPAPSVPDIALKEKTEKPKPVEKKPPILDNRKEKESKAQKEKERELKAQQARLDAEIARLQREHENSRPLREQAAMQSRLENEVAEYKARILAKIKGHIITPADLPGNPVAEFDVTLLPGGDILDVRLRRSSGFAQFDEAVERAIFLAKPLPLPPDPGLFPRFRNLNLKVHYQE